MEHFEGCLPTSSWNYFFFFGFPITQQHTEGLPVREGTENEAQEDDRMSAPLDCQEAKESKDKATDDLSSCYKDRTDGSQSLPILSKPSMMLDLKIIISKNAITLFTLQ